MAIQKVMAVSLFYLDPVPELSALCLILGRLLVPTEGSNSALRTIPNDVDFHFLISLADHHCVTPSLFEALDLDDWEDGNTPFDISYVKMVRNLNLARNRDVLVQLVKIASALNSADIEFVFLKGSALLIAGIYPTLGCRFVGDIDILIRPGQIERAGAVLREAGYGERRLRQPDSHDVMFFTHPHWPAALDVHQFVLNRELRHRLHESAFLDKKRPVTLPEGATTYIPSPDDMVTHNIWHAMVHHPHLLLSEIPLRDALDLCLMSRAFQAQIDWERIVGRLKEDDRGPAILDFYCNTARTLFGSANVPRFPRTPEAMLSRSRWRSRNGRRAYPYEDRGRLRNVAESIVWRYLVDREGRKKMTRSILEFRRYGAHIRRIREIADNIPKTVDKT